MNLKTLLILAINKKMPKQARNTRQKELLDEEVNKFGAFFSAEELLSKAKKKDEKIGIATVYRFLKGLSDKRKIHSYTCCRKTIYSVDKRSHCHFICEKCGKVSHIDVSSIDFIKDRIKGSICHFQIDVTGICDDCKKKEK